MGEGLLRGACHARTLPGALVALRRSDMRIAFPKRRLALISRLAPVAALVVMCLSVPAAAGADVGATIISRCTNGESLSGFSQSAYRRALQELPTEVEEYSDCANLIRRAQLAAAGQGGSSGEPDAPRSEEHTA